MKKYIFVLSMILYCGTALSQEAVDDFYMDLLEGNNVKQEKESKKAALSAGEMLNQQIKTPKIDMSDFQKEKEDEEKDAPLRKIAPFGVYWGASREDIKNMGVNLTGVVDAKNFGYSAEDLPRAVKDFNVRLYFSENDSLWKIVADSVLKEDNSGATNALALYKKYYDFLQKKYGPCEEEYKEKEGIKIGQNGFFKALQNEDAKLSCSFSADDVSAVLKVITDDENRSGISIEYENEIMVKDYEQDIIDSL